MSRDRLTVDQYCSGVRGGDVAILARALTLIESTNRLHQPLAEQVLTRLLPQAGQAIRVGITGVPGAGKSTFIDTLGEKLVGRGSQVAVLAVDPSSGISGGSILGDKTRMPRLAASSRAYIRPSPAADTLGGVARRTRESMLICEAAGYHVILVETVGVGQSETEVASMTDCFLALMLPGAGDELQGMKRGLLELAHVIAVNKADGAFRSTAEQTAQHYRLALQTFASRHAPAADVLTCSALTGTGVDAVWNAIERRQAMLTANGELSSLRQRQNLAWLWDLVEDQVRQAIHGHPDVKAVRARLEAEVLSGKLPAATAARRILDALGLRT